MPETSKRLVCPKCQSTEIREAAYQKPRAAELLRDGERCPVWVDYVCANGHEFAVDVAGS